MRINLAQLDRIYCNHPEASVETESSYTGPSRTSRKWESRSASVVVREAEGRLRDLQELEAEAAEAYRQAEAEAAEAEAAWEAAEVRRAQAAKGLEACDMRLGQFQAALADAEAYLAQVQQLKPKQPKQPKQPKPTPPKESPEFSVVPRGGGFAVLVDGELYEQCGDPGTALLVLSELTGEHKPQATVSPTPPTTTRTTQPDPAIMGRPRNKQGFLEEQEGKPKNKAGWKRQKDTSAPTYCKGDYTVRQLESKGWELVGPNGRIDTWTTSRGAKVAGDSILYWLD